MAVASENQLQLVPVNYFEYMKHDVYKAACEGKMIDEFKNYGEQLHLLVNRDQSTILHVHFASRREGTLEITYDRVPHLHFASWRLKSSEEFTREAIQLCPSLLYSQNAHGDTPLHLASRNGHQYIVETLIEAAKAQPNDMESGATKLQEVLRKTNRNKDTALHEAARNGHEQVVNILTKSDPDFLYSGNSNGETPLFLAGMRSFDFGTISGTYILDNCKSVDYGGPNGQTAAHASITTNRLLSQILEKTYILEKRKDLVKEPDNNGWTPLHYAAYMGRSSTVEMLLNLHCDVGVYASDKERKRTPLHLAACKGHFKVMKMIIEEYPDCSALVDDKGWNVVHYVVISKNDGALTQCYSHPLLLPLFDMEDAQGNTPLHFLYASRPFLPSFLKHNLLGYQRNKHNLLPWDFEADEHPHAKQEILKHMKDLGNGSLGPIFIGRKGYWEDPVMVEYEKAKDSYLVVATLIATVTFAAAFTLPGGLNDDGTAILRTDQAFQAFMISDAIAMALSISSIFIHAVLVLLGYRARYKSFMKTALLFIILAMAAMVIAFVTGVYAMLKPSKKLAIFTCLVGLSFFLYVSYMLGIMFFLKLRFGHLSVKRKKSQKSIRSLYFKDRGI